MSYDAREVQVMGLQGDYRSSHAAPGKGVAYQENFFRYKWRGYLWGQEQGVLAQVLSDLGDAGRVRHLDFACGTGRILKFLAPRVGVSTGIDVSPSMLEVCRRECPNAKIIMADISRAQVLEPGSFDLITAFRFFPNAQDDLRQAVIGRLASLLAPGGRLVFNNHKHSGSITFGMLKLVGRGRRVMSFRDVRNLVESAGLQIERTYSFGCLPAEERVMIFPASVHTTVDRAASVIGLARYIGQNQIYVCRRIAETPDERGDGEPRTPVKSMKS